MMLTNRVFRFAKRSNLKIVVMKGIQFADIQESCFETWKRSNMGISVLLRGRSAGVQEFCFHTAKRSDMVCAEMLIVRNGIFRLRNVQIRVVPPCKRVFC